MMIVLTVFLVLLVVVCEFIPLLLLGILILDVIKTRKYWEDREDNK